VNDIYTSPREGGCISFHHTCKHTHDASCSWLVQIFRGCSKPCKGGYTLKCSRQCYRVAPKAHTRCHCYCAASMAWLVPMCAMTHRNVRHDAWHTSRMLLLTASATILCETWLIPMCDVPHSYVWLDSFPCVLQYLIFLCTPWLVKYLQTATHNSLCNIQMQDTLSFIHDIVTYQ